MYLQDPLGCDRRVPYRNPHIMPPETGEILMTDPLRSLAGNLEIERLDVGPDLLAKLMADDEAPLGETEATDIVTTKLYRFVPYYQAELIY
jgi:SWI/SNF-related matrix-associated actin-dependent regulator of chromatin subfamily A3